MTRTDDELGLEYFDEYFAFAPAALAIRECARLAAMRGVELPEPILDVGCGDGLFARICYPDRQVWGIDINPTEIRRAQKTDTYKTLVCGSITSADLPESYFRSAVANCSLEHVPDIDAAFRTIARSLRPGAPFVLIVPTPDWTAALLVPQILDSIGLGVLGSAYRNGLDRVFHHVHLYDDKKWAALLDRAGFTVDRVDSIVSPGVTRAFDLLLYPSVSGWLTKQVTGHWTISPPIRRLFAGVPREVVRAITRALESRDGKSGPAEYVIHARKRAAGTP